MTERAPLIVSSTPNAVSNAWQMDQVRKGDTLRVVQRDQEDPQTRWEIQTDQGHRIAGIEWPAGATPAAGSLLVTSTTPSSPKRADHITKFSASSLPNYLVVTDPRGNIAAHAFTTGARSDGQGHSRSVLSSVTGDPSPEAVRGRLFRW